MVAIKFLSSCYVHTILGMIELTDADRPTFMVTKKDYKIIDSSKAKVDYVKKLMIGENTVERYLRSVTPISVEVRPHYDTLYRIGDVFFYKISYRSILIYDDIEKIKDDIGNQLTSGVKFHMGNIEHIEKFRRIDKKFDALYDSYAANKYVEMPPELDRIYKEFFDEGKLTKDSIETLNILAAGMK